jgi:hypothetical protein
MRKPANPVACAACSKMFVPDRNKPGPRYCSKKCIWKATKGPEFNARIAKASAAKRGDIQRGRGEGKAYRKRDGRHEHRIVAEQKLGRKLLRSEVVHHKDGDKLNNAPDNLIVMRQGKHMQEHGLGIPGMKLLWEPWKYRKDRS